LPSLPFSLSVTVGSSGISGARYNCTWKAEESVGGSVAALESGALPQAPAFVLQHDAQAVDADLGELILRSDRSPT
jgi:hypothetical protein